MNAEVIDDTVELLPALMQGVEAIAFVARHFHPPDFDTVMEAIGAPEDAIRPVRQRLYHWPDAFTDIRQALELASDATLSGLDSLRNAPRQNDSLGAVRRALRNGPLAQEALYSLCARFPPVSQFFIDPQMRRDASLMARLDQPGKKGETGVIHFDNRPGSRGGYSVYVPEYYSPDQKWPLVVALHGGGGHGSAFLWSWLRDARSHGAVLVSPTAIGNTWSLTGEDFDTPNLIKIIDFIRLKWNIDENRRLMTGMSDGGTFCYVSGLEASSPFTHIAPVSASFHPLLAEIADEDRIQGLPIFLVHGERDWMFPVEIARQAENSLAMAGADVQYREITDLSHCYPREINGEIMKWFNTIGK